MRAGDELAARRRDAAIAKTTTVMMPERCSRSASIQTRERAAELDDHRGRDVADARSRAAMITRDSTSPSTTLPTVTTSSVGTTLQPDRNAGDRARRPRAGRRAARSRR